MWQIATYKKLKTQLAWQLLNESNNIRGQGEDTWKKGNVTFNKIEEPQLQESKELKEKRLKRRKTKKPRLKWERYIAWILASRDVRFKRSGQTVVCIVISLLSPSVATKYSV